MSVGLGIYVIALATVLFGWYLFKGRVSKVRGRFSHIRADRNFMQLKSFYINFQKIRFLEKIKQDKKDKEIYEAISLLRNMNTINLGIGMSTEAVLEQLADLGGELKETYLEMLSMVRMNKREEAALVFHERIGSKISRDFGRLLIQWDDINPEDLTETLISHQKSIKEIRITEQKRKDEVTSDLIFFPVVVNVIVILINFVYVGYFIQQQEMLTQMF